MPYPLALNDIVQLNIVYAQVNVVRQMNTFHFRFSGGPIPADGRAAITTFITDWSRTMTNCAMANATSGNHRFMGPPPDGAAPSSHGRSGAQGSSNRPMTTASQISPFFRG